MWIKIHKEYNRETCISFIKMHKKNVMIWSPKEMCKNSEL